MTESMEPEDDDGNMSETSLPGGFHAIWVHVYVSCLGNTTDAFSTPGKKKSVRARSSRIQSWPFTYPGEL